MTTRQHQLPFDFNSFGDVGVVFSYAYSNLHGRTCLNWSNQFPRPWAEVLEEHLTPTFLWLNSLFGLQQGFGVPIDEVSGVWERFRFAFSDPLLPRDQVSTRVPERGSMMNLIGAEQVNLLKDFTNKCLTCVSYGPFDEPQLRFMVENCASGIELGCGSGYLVDVLRKRGLSILGIDSNAYKAVEADGSEESTGIMDMCPWSKRLLGQGALIQGDESSLAKYKADERSLIISWPMPGSDFPFKALKAYREAGGQRFFLKLGGLVGTYGGSQPTLEAGRGVLRFFDEIATYWGPSKNTPDYNPLHMFNNLWCFDLAESPRK